MSKSFLNNKNLSRGLRNNNPGNLIKSGIGWQGKIKGTDSRFETFSTLFFGLRAMATDIANDITLDGLDTLGKLIEKYAPRFENDTDAYIARVGSDTGLLKNEPINLTPELLAKIMRSKINVENGKDAALISDADIIEGIRGVNASTARRIGLEVKKK